MPSKDFERFYESCFDDSFGAVHGGVDEQAIANLKDDERKEAERLLLQALGTSRDTYSRPVIGLGLLGSQEAAEPLEQRLEKATSLDRIHTALALFRIERFPGAEKIIIDGLSAMDMNKPDVSTRWLAVQILPYLGRTSRIVNALTEAMFDEDIGNSAVVSLRTLFIEDEAVRDLLGQILLNLHDAHKPDWVPRKKLVQQAMELINTRLSS